MHRRRSVMPPAMAQFATLVPRALVPRALVLPALVLELVIPRALARRTFVPWALPLRALALVAIVAAAAPAWAIRAPDSPLKAGASSLRPPPWVAQQVEDEAANADRAAADPALARLGAAGRPWSARYDVLTDRVSLAWGSMPFIPGGGNCLDWSDLGLTAEPEAGAPLRGMLETRARAFLKEHPDLFRIPADVEIVLDSGATVSLDHGRIAQVHFDAHVGGVPVEGAGVTLRLRMGNLVQLGTARIGDALSPVDSIPRIANTAALAIAVKALGEALEAGVARRGDGGLDVAEVLDQGSLLILPWLDAGGRQLDYRLAWRVSFRLAGRHETWVAHVDARDGELLGLHDANLYACAQPPAPRAHVTAAVQIGPAEEAPVSLRAMPFVLVDQGGAPGAADLNGTFARATDVDATARLVGTVGVACVSCEQPPQALARAGVSTELSFGWGGTEAVGNGASTAAERNAYYHLALVHRLARGHLDDADVGGWFTRGQAAMVNLEDTCNGFASVGATFYLRGGAGCRNPAEVPDVMYHEWGHSLDLATLAGTFDYARSEGMADTMAILATHDQRMAPYFYRGDAGGIRQADERASTLGVMTVSRVVAECGTGNGPMGGEPHCEGQVFLQAHWHLGELLRAALGQAAGWRALERLYFLSLPLSDTYLPDQTDSAYDAVVLVDDDDGDLGNGTPNGAAIAAAFGHHEMASTPAVGDSPARLPLPRPALAVSVVIDASTGFPDASLTWTASPGAASYDVLRNEGLGSEAFARIASVAAPGASHVDAGLLDSVTYRYCVVARDALGLESQPSATVSVTPPPSLRLRVASVTVGDLGGDSDGRLDRGERCVIGVSIDNVGSLPCTAVSATLSSSHPGITMRRATAGVADLPAGGRADTVVPHFEIQVEPYAVGCAETVPFLLEVESAEGCALLSFELEVGDDGRADVLSDDFESDGGWIVDPGGTDAATGGFWVREPPNATWMNFQPGEDHSTPGMACWVTGNRAGADLSELGDDDVDGGCTTLQSTVFALGGQPALELSWWRRLLLGAGGDALVVDVSGDGGRTWVTVEMVTASAPSWERVVVDLDAVLGAPPRDLVVRFSACDAGPESYCEVLVDDVAVQRRTERCGCALSAPPPPAGDVLRATGRKDEDGAEFEWSLAPAAPEWHYRLVRRTTPAGPATSVTPPGHVGLSHDDRAAPGALYFYSLRLVDCLGTAGPD